MSAWCSTYCLISKRVEHACHHAIASTHIIILAYIFAYTMYLLYTHFISATLNFVIFHHDDQQHHHHQQQTCLKTREKTHSQKFFGRHIFLRSFDEQHLNVYNQHKYGRKVLKEIRRENNDQAHIQQRQFRNNGRTKVKRDWKNSTKNKNENIWMPFAVSKKMHFRFLFSERNGFYRTLARTSTHSQICAVYA